MEINDFSQTGIYPDLINEFSTNGHDIYVVSPCEKKNKKRYKLLREKGHIHLISAMIPNYYGEQLFQKGYSSLVIGKKYLEAIYNSIPTVKFDLVLYSTPPITFVNVIEKIKRRDKANTYLLLKDIWPQGPIDIGSLSTGGLKGIVTRYFKRKEIKLYKISDFIGCMSEKNRQYLVENSNIDSKIIDICPNSIKIRDPITVDSTSIRNKYGLPVDKTIFVYGGNLGVAQGIDFIISCLSNNESNSDTFFLIVGSGTEYNRLKKWFEINKPKNSKIISYLPKNEYMRVMASCDVGLIFLDHRFTIPNFPSRLLSYMEGRMPVLAATDTATDIGQVIVDGKFGYWCKSDNVNEFNVLLKRFIDRDEREKMGDNAYNYLVMHYDVKYAYEVIVSHFS